MGWVFHHVPVGLQDGDRAAVGGHSVDDGVADWYDFPFGVFVNGDDAPLVAVPLLSGLDYFSGSESTNEVGDVWVAPRVVASAVVSYRPCDYAGFWLVGPFCVFRGLFF